MDGEICPKTKINPTLQLGTGEYTSYTFAACFLELSEAFSVSLKEI